MDKNKLKDGHVGFKVVDTIGDYELLALQFDDNETPKFNEAARSMYKYKKIIIKQLT